MFFFPTTNYSYNNLNKCRPILLRKVHSHRFSSPTLNTLTLLRPPHHRTLKTTITLRYLSRFLVPETEICSPVILLMAPPMTTSWQPLWRLLQISIWTVNMKPFGAAHTNKTLLRYCLVKPTTSTRWPHPGTLTLVAWNLLLCYLVRGLVTQVLQMEDRSLHFESV